MSNSIVGNNGAPQDFTTWWETEVDDDEYEDLEGEITDEEDVFGYRAIVPKNSNSTTVTIYFYYYAPISEWFWDYMYGLPYSPIVPLVFATDSDWNLTQCLNASFYEFSLTGLSNGWKALNVTLTRKLVKGEKIFFGVYSDLLGYVATGEVEDGDTTNSYFYWTRARRQNYSSQIAYVSSPDFISQQRKIFCDWEMCIYMQYENEPDSIFYTRSVLGNVGAVTSNSRKVIWKRTMRPGGNLTSVLSRKSVFKRNANSSESLASVCQRHNLLKRRSSSVFIASSGNSNRIFFFRFLEGSGSLSSRVSRANRMKIEKSDGFSLTDNLQQLLLIIRSCFSSAESTESLRLKAEYTRKPESVVDDEETITRCGDNFRSFIDEASFEARPFASRLFFRTVQTVMSLWDWLRGKIREANNVITLFSPIYTEITMESKI